MTAPLLLASDGEPTTQILVRFDTAPPILFSQPPYYAPESPISHPIVAGQAGQGAVERN